MVQGITGREASVVTRHMLDYGTKVVAGITPGKGGQEVHTVPVYDALDEAVSKHRANVSIVYVPAPYVRDAALEAVDNGLPLIIIITERVPQRDIIEITAFAQSRGSRVIGPNTVGIIRPDMKTKLGPVGGDHPERIFIPGKVAIISRSGGMSAETAWMLRRSDIGVSVSVSIGGDAILGTTMKELLEILNSDDSTHAAVLFCEPGGNMEAEVADFVSTGGFAKPIVAYVAGRFTEALPHGVKFGHAGSIIQNQEGIPSVKMEKLRHAGILVAQRFSEIPHIVKNALAQKPC